MMLLADCYRVPRLGVPLDLLGYVAPVVAAPSYRCWGSFVSASFAWLVTHSTHKHGFRRTAYNYVTEFGDCFGCLKTFHTKRRLLDHLTRTKNPICLNRIISNYAPMYDADALNMVMVLLGPQFIGMGHRGMRIVGRSLSNQARFWTLDAAVLL